MTKKVLLIDPPFQKFMDFSKNGIPLGLLYLAGSLKREGHSVEVLDSDYNPNGTPYPFMAKIEHYDEYLQNLHNGNHHIWGGIASQIEESKPDVVGISMISTKLQSGLKVAEIAKKMGVERVIAGGPHVTIFPKDALESNYVDSVVLGEGEEVFERALVERVVKADRIRDIKSLVWPARETLIGVENYRSDDLGFGNSSRGCSGSCNFCCSESLWGKSVRMRDIKDFVAELDSVHENYGTNKFYVVDDTFTLGKKRVESFCDSIRNRGYEWSCLTRVDKFDKSMLEQMAGSGCSMIKVGIESGSQKVLDLMNKKTSVEQVEAAANLLNEHPMPWLAYIMVGVPGETSCDVDKTMELIDKVRPSYVSAAIYTPYPGTGFSKQENGLDFAREEANHHSMKVLAGDVSREKIVEFMEFADKYNHDSKKAHELYNVK